ncbi:MAG: hypothetical protein V1929_06155 [bacterium]
MNTNNEKPNSEKAWTFVHGELGEDARQDFEGRMSHDGAIRALVGEVQDCDRELRRLAPFASVSEEELQERVLAAWDAGQANEGDRGNPSIRRNSVVLKPASRRPHFQFNKPVRLAFAAAACGIVAVVGVRQMQTPAFVWEVEIIQQAKYRGAGGEEALPRYTRADMTELTSSLRASVEDEFRYLANRDRTVWPGWVLSTRIQELESGRLAVQVQAYKSKGEKPIKEWLKNYADAQSFRARVYDYGRQIVEDLAQLGHGTQDYIE